MLDTMSMYKKNYFHVKTELIVILCCIKEDYVCYVEGIAGSDELSSHSAGLLASTVHSIVFTLIVLV